jgi:hypothetical protein
MSDFKKILDHPEKQKIIDKLVGGDSPKDVAQYLKIKYSDDDQKHLRVPASLLKEFADKHLDQCGFLNKVIKADRNGKLDSKIAESLVNNETWKDRLARYADREIDLKDKILQMLHMLEIRSEQLFDKIQENPGGIKIDYVMAKYFDLLFIAIEKADKIVNERPDQLIEHTYTVQMVEEYSVAIQEAIREVLLEMGPEHSARFMELLNAKLSGIKNPGDAPVRSFRDREAEAKKLLAKGEKVDAEMKEAGFEDPDEKKEPKK